jgi:hypothetical protein
MHADYTVSLSTKAMFVLHLHRDPEKKHELTPLTRGVNRERRGRGIEESNAVKTHDSSKDFGYKSYSKNA